ncbi:hypothetical protein O181_024448 [Austropuccinia psidii MF-1]|uniref:Uncharacterized protein n=1 Tax=Austropuccinia psidii MF-1 TaxID=1389203 RepID=A0A9Q3GY82_9BASI|nr:hypothetical protein [Austropuccinia psidii MF-1]
MSQPWSYTITVWAKLTAASASETMEEFCIPSHAPQEELDVCIDRILYLEGFKRLSIPIMEIVSISPHLSTSSANFDNPSNCSSDSDQRLKPFQDLISDVMISYMIFKAQAMLEETTSIKRSNRHKNLRKRTMDAEASQFSSLVTPPTLQEMTMPCTIKILQLA